MVEKKPLLYVGLGYKSAEDNLRYAEKLASVDSDRFGFKPNLFNVADFSPGAMNAHDYVKETQAFGKPVFVDMKMWNGGGTMANVAESCAALGVNMINVYGHAGAKFIRRIADAIKGTSTKLFGLTVLTHYTNADTQELYRRDMGPAIEMLGQRALDGGADGIILPGTQLHIVRDWDCEKLTPGIRPLWYEKKKTNDQEQIVDPTEAIREGANYLVVDSPVRTDENPVAALERILEEMDNAA